MADLSIWQNKKARAAFEAKAKARLGEIAPQLEGQTGVVAIEPNSGDFFVGATLGKADALAFAKYPDQWVYFVRLDNHEAAIPMPAW